MKINRNKGKSIARFKPGHVWHLDHKTDRRNTIHNPFDFGLFTGLILGVVAIFIVYMAKDSYDSRRYNKLLREHTITVDECAEAWLKAPVSDLNKLKAGIRIK
jgi:hypothetical protein